MYIQKPVWLDKKNFKNPLLWVFCGSSAMLGVNILPTWINTRISVCPLSITHGCRQTKQASSKLTCTLSKKSCEPAENYWGEETKLEPPLSWLN